jgi:hypothetical protein
VPRVEPGHARQARVDDHGDAFHGERRLGDVGREHDPPPRSRTERTRLRVERQIAMERRTSSPRGARASAARRMSAAPGRKTSTSPGGRQRPSDRAGDARIEARVRRIVVLDRDGVGSALRCDHGDVAERRGETVGVERSPT